jgi:carbamoyltransferase
MKKNYIGLACTGHDNALAIVNSEGEVVFAEATERSLQSKRAYNCAPDAILELDRLVTDYCEPDAEIVIAKTWSDQAISVFQEEIALTSKRRDAVEPSLHAKLLHMEADVYEYYLSSFATHNIQNAGDHLRFFLERKFGKKVSVRAYNHHLTHAATGCFTSGFQDAACIVVDGNGEGVSTSCYAYKNGKLREVDEGTTRILGNAARSLGNFYGYLCSWCGFDVWRGEEWKVMGLAPYGKLNQKVYDLLHERMRVDDLVLDCPESGEKALARIATFFRTPRQPSIAAADLAYTGQVVFGELMSQLINALYDRDISENLVLGGGCGLNSSYNGKIVEQTRFRRAHVFAAPADDGNALGAALLAYADDHPERRINQRLQSPYLGSSMSRDVLGKLVTFGELPRLTHAPDDVCARTAKLLADGKIVGWVQGRAEFGPRALGNRSILADPRRTDMKDRINARVKFREEFRPFAPSILEEYGEEYFVNYQPTPYMERTLAFKDEVRDRVPAVVHVDGTGRLQTVKKEWNPRYYELIREFHALTGVPIVLNTSLNVMGKPIVHSVEDAIAVLFTSGLDAMVIEDYLIEK